MHTDFVMSGNVMSLLRRLKPQHLHLMNLIAERRQLQVAAEAMGLSQPAASRALAEMERELGGALFYRHPRGMEATELGAACLRHARAILSGFESLETEVTELQRGTAGEVRVGTVTGPAVGCVVPAVQAVKAETPGIRVTVDVGPSAQLVRGLQEGTMDFIVARLPPGVEGADFELYPARNEVAELMVRRSHPLAGQGAVALADTLPFEWVIQERGSPIRVAVEGAFRGQGLPVPPRVTNSSSLLVALAMLAGDTSVITSLSAEAASLLAAGPLAADLVTLPLVEPILVTPYFVISHRYRQHTRAAGRLMQETLARL